MLFILASGLRRWSPCVATQPDQSGAWPSAERNGTTERPSVTRPMCVVIDLFCSVVVLLIFSLTSPREESSTSHAARISPCPPGPLVPGFAKSCLTLRARHSPKSDRYNGGAGGRCAVLVWSLMTPTSRPCGGLTARLSYRCFGSLPLAFPRSSQSCHRRA
jgi:hypothetical protein